MSAPRARTRADALALLGVTPKEVEAQPEITHILKRAKVYGQVPEYLRGSSDPVAKKFLDAYDGLTLDQQKGLPLEAVAIAAGISTERLFEVIAGAVFSQSKYEGALLAAAAHPKVVQRSIERALEAPVSLEQTDGSVKVVLAPDGGADRKMLHQQAGFLPLPKTQFVSLPGVKSIDARQQTQNITVLPPVESSVKRMADRFGEKILGPTPEAGDAEAEDDE